jgi:alkanesulfonate monooxygenase SsuD/methylene tetrahydromethanopterin reductase-like flavin-dependent oxidoreductase (luciferase family)
VHCRAVGRDYDEIQQVIRVGVFIAETEAELKRLKSQPWVRPMDHGAIGAPDQVTETIRGIIAQGANRLTVHFADSPRPDGTQLFAAEVLPHLA